MPSAKSVPQNSNQAARGGQAAARADLNMMEDFAGIDEMGKRRPASRRLQLSEMDLTDQGLTSGRQRNVPKTIANATLPQGNALELDDLSRDLPKLPGDSGTRKKADLQWAARSNALEGIDDGPTTDNPQGRDESRRATEGIETLPVGPPAHDSGIMRVRLNASAVLSAVDYNDDMRGTTVEEAQRRSKTSGPAQKAKPAKPAKRGRRSRRGARASGSNSSARPTGGNGTVKKASARAAAPAPSASRRGKAEARSSPGESSRASRRSRASRAMGASGENNQMLLFGGIGGAVLLLIIIAIFAFSGSRSGESSSGKSGPTIDRSTDESASGLKQKAESLATGSESDRLQARDYFIRARDLFDANGDHASADDCARKADGLHKDAKLNFYPGKK